MRKILSILALSWCAAACIYPYTPELDEAPEGILSVDANISIGDVSTVRLGTLMSLYHGSEMVFPDLTNAKVWLEDDAGTTYPGKLDYKAYGYDHVGAYHPGIGSLFTIPTENVPGDRSYRLCIEALGAKYVSDWAVGAEPPVIKNISFSAENDNVTVHVSVDGGDNGSGYLLLSYDETWEFHVDYFPSYKVTYDEEMNRVFIQEALDGIDMSKYWCWKSADNGRSYPVDYTSMSTTGIIDYPLFHFDRRSNRNHKRYCVNIKAKSISKETYRFLKNLEENTNGGDNLFTPTPGEIAGNIRCESDPERLVLGYVLFSKATTKRGWLDRRYYRPQAPTSLDYILEELYVPFYKSGFLPLEKQENPPEGMGPYGWGSPRCYDCTQDGGTLNRPDFWEDGE